MRAVTAAAQLLSAAALQVVKVCQQGHHPASTGVIETQKGQCEQKDGNPLMRMRSVRGMLFADGGCGVTTANASLRDRPKNLLT